MNFIFFSVFFLKKKKTMKKKKEEQGGGVHITLTCEYNESSLFEREAKIILQCSFL